MKFPLLLPSLLAISAGSAFSQSTIFSANGPNAPALGSIVPEAVTFAVSSTPVSSFGNSLQELTNLEYFSYGDFPDEVVITLFHTPW